MYVHYLHFYTYKAIFIDLVQFRRIFSIMPAIDNDTGQFVVEEVGVGEMVFALQNYLPVNKDVRRRLTCVVAAVSQTAP